MSIVDDVTAAGVSAIPDVLAEAKKLISLARFNEAESLILRLFDRQLDPTSEIEICYTLAVVRRYRKDFAGATAATDRIIALNPDHGRTWQERGHTFLALNRPDDATHAFARAVALNPGLVASWKALVNLYKQNGRTEQARIAAAQVDYLTSLPDELAGVIDLTHEGKLYQAEQLCRNFLIRNEHHIDAMRLLADIGIRLQIYDDAEFLLESCVELEPDNIRARTDYLKILNRKGKFGLAYEQAEILCRLQPGNPAFQLSMAGALTGLGRYEEGVKKYQDLIEKHPDNPATQLLLGHARKAMGALDDAVACYHAAYHCRPDYGDAYWSLANTKTYRFTEAEIQQIIHYEAAPGVAYDDRVHLCFAAGKAYEDRGEYDPSFSYYERGNALKQQKSGYSADKTSAMVQAQIDTCTRELFEQRGRPGYPCPDPIFIVGMPRSGSTLLEQILASHSLIDGTLELHDVLGLVQRLRGRNAEQDPRYPGILWRLEDDYFKRFGEQFINNTRIYRGQAPYFIDKMPNNFMHIGLIHLILPDAKIIDARRSAMACCFSNFKQLFGEGQDFSYGLESMGRYYCDYVKLMQHWDGVLPGKVLRVQYEDVVADLETQVHRILDFLELPFEEQCLDFHQTDRAIRTPSSEQVRQPIYEQGLEQWKHYEPWLGPLTETLQAYQ